MQRCTKDTVKSVPSMSGKGLPEPDEKEYVQATVLAAGIPAFNAGIL